jgi:hypothetical protein
MPQRMRVCNTPQYNDSLKKKGDIFSILNQATEVWLHCDVEMVEKSKYVYSQVFINLRGCLRYLLGFPFRQLAGFLESYLNHVGLSHLPSPDYSTLCRRLKKEKLNIKDFRTDQEKVTDRYVELLVDSSGISIYATGSGHGKENASVRRHKHYDQVRKLHVLLDLKTGNVLDMEMTEGASSDFLSGTRLIENCELPIESVRADAAYDRKPFRKACHQKGAKQIIPPQLNACMRKPKKADPPDLWKERNEAVRMMEQAFTRDEGRKQWKEQIKYGKRAKVEGSFHRFKKAFGFSFMSASEEGRLNELVYVVQWDRVNTLAFRRTL